MLDDLFKIILSKEGICILDILMLFFYLFAYDLREIVLRKRVYGEVTLLDVFPELTLKILIGVVFSCIPILQLLVFIAFFLWLLEIED
jgi:hypothetical protein